MNNIDLCKNFTIKRTSEGAMVVTPFRYDDGSPISVFVREETHQTYIVDDNGEAATRLLFEGVDMDSSAIQTWLKNLSMLHNISWSDATESLAAHASESELEKKILAVAEASAQMQALVALKRDRKESQFKQQVMDILREIQEETKIEVRYNVPVDNAQQLVADAWFIAKQPLIIVAATSSERLLEAELIWANAQRDSDSSYVLAVIESAAAVGAKQFQRAQYYTSKTVEFSGMPMAFKKLVTDQVTAH